MPRTTNGRSSPASGRRHTNGITQIHSTRPVGPYSRDARWATPSSRRRTDVFVVDLADRYAAPANAVDDDSLLLTA